MAEPFDPLKEIQESMKAHNQLKEIQESMRAHNQLKEIQESMQAFQFHDQLKAIRESMQALQLHDTLKGIQEFMQAPQFRDQLETIRESMQAPQLQDTLKGIRESLQAPQFHNQLEAIRDSMRALQLHDPLKAIRDSMQALQFYEPLKEFREPIEMLRFDRILDAVSKDNWPLAYVGNAGDFIVNSDNTVTVDNQTLSYGEIQKLANQITSKASDKAEKNLEHFVSEIIKEIRALKHPLLERILTWLVFPIVVALILSVINPIADFYIKETLSVNKRQTEKQIKRHIVESVDSTEQLKDCRLVTGDILNVRATPSSKAPILGVLRFGDIVLLIEKDKDWSLVTWGDIENNTRLQGWVFSRYLRKIK